MRSVLLLALLATAAGALAADPGQISIRYDGAGLTQVLVADGSLTCVTHTPKADLAVSAQDLTSYERRERTVPLAPELEKELVDWLHRCRLGEIARTYPATDPTSYAAAFRSTLEVSLGGVSYRASWDDTSDCGALREAIRQLEALCDPGTESEPRRQQGGS
jgi:hypothetical protein